MERALGRERELHRLLAERLCWCVAGVMTQGLSARVCRSVEGRGGDALVATVLSLLGRG